MVATDLEPFVRAVVAAPEDDLPRLIFADWLEEHGGALRSEFIRVQIELARMDADAVGPAGLVSRSSPWRRSDPRLRWLMDREQELLITGGILPFRDLEGRDIPHGLVEFRRGFVNSISVTAQDWMAQADAILSVAPIRNSRDGLVRLTTAPETRYDDPQNPVRIRIPGRPWREVGCVDETDHWGRVLRLLAAEWPGVRFELPAAREELTIDRGLRDLGISRGTAARMNYITMQSLVNNLSETPLRRSIRAMEALHDLTREGD